MNIFTYFNEIFLIKFVNKPLSEDIHIGRDQTHKKHGEFVITVN